MTSACVTRRARPALGTFVEIAATGASPFDRDRAIAAGFAAVTRVHALMSFHERGSDLSRLNRARAECDIAVDPWTWQVLATAHELHEVSGGVFDIAVAPALQAAGLLPAIDGRRGEEMASAGRDPAFALPAPGRVRIMRRGAALDLGGIAKGFAVDRAVDAMKRNGITAGVVNAGGDLADFGAAPQTVHLRDPRDPGRIMAVIEVANEAVASSGGRIDPFGAATVTTSAIVDPAHRALLPAGCGATVRAPSCMIADALTKVVMIAGERAGPVLRRYHACALLLTGDGELRATGDWPERLRLAS
jgi:thiamine biosynthesis lipoprotein